MKSKALVSVLILVLLSVLCYNHTLYGDVETYYISETKGAKYLPMKEVNTCWDIINSKRIKPTKKDLRLAKSLYKTLKSLKSNKRYTLRLSNSEYKYYERIITIMNWKYFRYYEPNASMSVSRNSVIITYKGKNIKEAIRQNNRVEKLLNKIVKEIGLSKNTTEYNAVILIDRYLCGKIKYCDSDKEYERLIKKYKESEYQALFSGKGVCQDYANCFSLIAKKVGIKSGVVISGVEDHAYNVVYVDGKRYYCDSCWNWCVGDNRFLFMTRKSNVHDMSDSFIIW